VKITKFVHACLLVETPERVVLFDPGTMSEQALDVDKLERLDDIFITHEHADHFSLELVKKLVDKFPEVRITTTPEVVAKLSEESISASDQPPAGTGFFDAPHESVEPLFPSQPQEIGVHYLDTLSHPGDSHHFSETKKILALPVQAPWGSTVKAVEVALDLKPEHILPIHDWHWSDAARQQMYGMLEKLFADRGIKFHKLETGEPIEIDTRLKAAM
jgi:L-ascorbate metabolism protein UlaG (beta-lactamase superfamily)